MSEVLLQFRRELYLAGLLVLRGYPQQEQRQVGFTAKFIAAHF
jgi:hypothetical protein